MTSRRSCFRVRSREIGESFQRRNIAEAFEPGPIVIGHKAVEEGIAISMAGEGAACAAAFGFAADGFGDAAVGHRQTERQKSRMAFSARRLVMPFAMANLRALENDILDDVMWHATWRPLLQVSKWGDSLTAGLVKTMVEKMGLIDGDAKSTSLMRPTEHLVVQKETPRKAALERMASLN